MRFGEYLRSNLTPEWSGRYISYEDMKVMLTDVINQIPSINQINQNLTHEQYFRFADKYFFQVKISNKKNIYLIYSDFSFVKKNYQK